MQLQIAKREAVYVRLSLNAPSGFGKTKSALLIARGLCDAWEQIGVIDSENCSATIYADELGPYQHLDFPAPHSPQRYVAALNLCRDAGLKVVVIDSASHEWIGEGGMLEMTGKQFQEWHRTNPHHNAFLKAILTYPGHVILTTRAKTDFVIEQGEHGRKEVRKVGLKPQQREGLDYEMTVAFDIINDQHQARVTKNRTSLFPNPAALVVPTEQLGRELRAWAENPPPKVSERAALALLAAATTLDELAAVYTAPEHQHLARIGSEFTLEARRLKAVFTSATGVPPVPAARPAEPLAEAAGAAAQPVAPTLPTGTGWDTPQPPAQPAPAPAPAPEPTPESEPDPALESEESAPPHAMREEQKKLIERLLANPVFSDDDRAQTRQGMEKFSEERAEQCIGNLQEALRERTKKNQLDALRAGIRTLLEQNLDFPPTLAAQLKQALTDPNLTPEAAQGLLTTGQALAVGRVKPAAGVKVKP